MEIYYLTSHGRDNLSTGSVMNYGTWYSKVILLDDRYFYTHTIMSTIPGHSFNNDRDIEKEYKTVIVIS